MSILVGIERELLKIQEKICDEYCKKPEEYKKEHLEDFEKYPDYAQESFWKEVCAQCPLNNLV